MHYMDSRRKLVLIHGCGQSEMSYDGQVDDFACQAVERPISLYLGSLPR